MSFESFVTPEKTVIYFFRVRYTFAASQKRAFKSSDTHEDVYYDKRRFKSINSFIDKIDASIYM